MRLKRVGKVAGSFLSGPARRGRIRLADEEQSPVEEQVDGLDAAGLSQEPESQESQMPESQEGGSSQEPEVARSSFYVPQHRDFASGSPMSSREAIRTVLRSQSPPPPTLSSKKKPLSARALDDGPKQAQPVFKVPAPRPDLPAAHDQENEAPPTFKRNKQPLIQLDVMEKKPLRPLSIDRGVLRARSPERQPLAAMSQNTPRRAAPPPPKMSVLEAATTTAGAATTSHASKRRNVLKVNGKSFTRIDILGRGGSSKVFRVMAENSKFFALKRVSLDDADEQAVRGFKGEIDLLRKLESVDRVIRLYDYELNESKGTLSVLMEIGEMDMNSFLGLRLNSEHAKFDPSFVRHYWKEMLECLQAVHEYDIVHSDLKPHNFVLVQGRLKLIDFGIANAIQTDETVNVHRESQVGTPNYMSPESLLDSNAQPDSRGRINRNEPKLMKLGKPSDVWSLGCILYQMTYGRAPFAHIQNQMQRCQAIINFKYDIEYPSVGIGSVPVPPSLIHTLKRCLNRDQHKRPSCTELLGDTDPFLYPDLPANVFPMTEELLGRILQNVAMKCKDKQPSDAELLTLWPKGYFNSLRKGQH
ncbi:checkpoint protein [Phlyctema vagabunda]|uniref:Checkpoint protein n=1 Tax=Phlyctema vagabunda TaxID=108571 RepID=A0ABR4P5N9_9HELO